MRKELRYVGWIIVWFTSLFFIQNGIQKLVGADQMVNKFHELDYPILFMYVVGILEVVGGVLLAIPKLTYFAAIGLGIVMTGAVISELKAGFVFDALIPAQWLVLFVIIVYVRHRIGKTKKASAQEVELK